MSGEFLDSHVFIYVFDETDDYKKQIAADLVIEAIRGSTGVISYQVIQEVLNVLTTKIAVPLRHEDALSYFTSTLKPLWTIYPTDELFARALTVRARYHYGFYDSLIIAAAIQAGCSTIYTEDMQHGQLVENVRIVDPFRKS